LSQVRFEVAPAAPHEHRFRVVCELAQAQDAVFRLPSWIRGSYLVRDFAKHVVWLRAEADGHAVEVERLDKRSFRVPGKAGLLRLEYEVYAYDPSVRKAYLDTRRGFFNGSSLFYCPDGCEQAEFQVRLLRPDPALCRDWRVATSLRALEVDAEGFGVYSAPNYEDLIDHPVEMAAYRRIDFEVDGIAHALVLSGRCEVDAPRLAADLGKICHVQRQLFGQEPKLDRYLFLAQVTGNGYGGLEHRSSTALVCSRDALPRPGQNGLRKGYRGFLGLCSHEYFHLWNVKRITPLPFAENRLGAEAYSRDLWAYEGVTSYYDDLMLLRAAVLDAPAYLDLVAEAATRLQRTPGRQVQTLADASFEAWIKYYQPDENTPNQAVSYYVKGALAALCLDLELRLRSLVTLDDVMRALWSRYGAQDRAAPEGALEALASELSGLDLKPFCDRLLRSTAELPLAELLAEFGVKSQLRAASGPADEGGRSDAKGAPGAWLGLQLRAGDTGIAHVLSHSPAARAGLSGGDVLVALDGLRVSSGNWGKLLETLATGREIAVHYFTDDATLIAEDGPGER
jgi:predicted metalloprotease with PDZ domain